MTSIGSIVDAERCSSYQKLLGVPVNVLKSVRKCRKQIVGDRSDLVDEAEQLWIKEVQLAQTNRIKKAKVQVFQVFTENGVWRCGGRSQSAGLSRSEAYPILLIPGHRVTESRRPKCRCSKCSLRTASGVAAEDRSQQACHGRKPIRFY